MSTSGSEAMVYVLDINLPFLRVRLLCESCEAFPEILPSCLRVTGLAVIILENEHELRIRRRPRAVTTHREEVLNVGVLDLLLE